MKLHIIIVGLFVISGSFGQNTGTLNLGTYEKENQGSSGTLNLGSQQKAPAANKSNGSKTHNVNASSGVLNLVNKVNLINEIEQSVNNEIFEWQQKGKYEKTVDYQNRVNAQSRQAKIKELTQQKMNALANERFVLSVAKDEYDADNEVFKIEINGLLPIYIKVPIKGDEAEQFGENISKLEFDDAQFTLTPSEEFAILRCKIINPANGKGYQYNSQEKISFNHVEVTTNYAAVKVKVKSDFGGQEVASDNITIQSGASDVDVNIPSLNVKRENTYALIIGNEDYHSYQDGLNSEVDVLYAESDARIFKEYCTKTLGIPGENISMVLNARMMTMRSEIDKIVKIAGILGGQAEILFYYAGHGLPDEVTKEPYLIPVDVNASNLQYAISLKEVYAKLSSGNPNKVTVLLDACFSGGAREQGLLVARGVKVKPKDEKVEGKMVVFSASSGEQSALPYKDKQHGMFTYYLLKYLQENKGKGTFGEMSDYLKKNVGIKSVQVNNKEQTPQTNISTSLGGDWRSINF